MLQPISQCMQAACECTEATHWLLIVVTWNRHIDFFRADIHAGIGEEAAFIDASWYPVFLARQQWLMPSSYARPGPLPRLRCRGNDIVIPPAMGILFPNHYQLTGIFEG